MVDDPFSEIRTGERIQSTSSSALDKWNEMQANFLIAIEEGNIERAQLLFSKDKLVVGVQKSGGTTILHIACSKGHRHMVRWILDVVKMEIEKPDDCGYRAIHHAALK